MTTNKYGLSRNIPARVAQQVRQECGFGCVICGASLTQYDHVDPVHAEAINHEASCIALLCGSCHDRKTRKFCSAETIAAARLQPKCRSTGFSWGEFDFGGEAPPILLLGSNVISQCRVALEVAGEPALAFSAPEAPGGPFRLNAKFRDGDNAPLLEVFENEWRVNSGSWDATFVGGKIDIQSPDKLGHITLECLPPTAIRVLSMDLRLNGARLVCDGDGFGYQHGHGLKQFIRGAQLSRSPVGMSV